MVGRDGGREGVLISIVGFGMLREEVGEGGGEGEGLLVWFEILLAKRERES